MTKKIKINFSTAPPKRNVTKEELDNLIDKSINLILDDLILNGHLKVGN